MPTFAPEFAQNALARDLLSTGRRQIMLWTLVLFMLVLWALGLATSYTLGGLLHILLVVAVVAAVIQLVQGRRAV